MKQESMTHKRERSTIEILIEGIQMFKQQTKAINDINMFKELMENFLKNQSIMIINTLQTMNT